MSLPSLVDLLEAGVHFGHETSKWNPKMKPYIFTERNHVHVLDLQQTLTSLEKAATFARNIAGKGGVVLFVGTKRQARAIVKAEAERCGMPFITTRWLGGTFTNFETILKSINKLENFRVTLESPEAEMLTKKERAVLKNEIKRLDDVLQGLKELRKMPNAVFLVGAHNEKIAVKEAVRRKVPMIALVDTNADPSVIDYPIPANDDAVRSLEIIVKTIADAVLEGKSGIKTVDVATTAVKG
ncbi:MAG: 30S ribosomal protein S2 [bacterium]|nr:30S ribosomal protein S2 [bacterium]